MNRLHTFFKKIDLETRPFFQLFLMHFGIVLLSSFAFRTYLAAFTPGLNFRTLYFSVLTGFMFDFTVALITFVPLIFIVVASPKFLLGEKRLFGFLRGILFIDLSFFIFGLCAEFVFYGEFADRFNFIAVDYLVYTHEIFKNIIESYPVLPVLSCVLGTAASCAYFLIRILPLPNTLITSWPSKFALVVFFATAAYLATATISERYLLRGANNFEELVAKNGLFALATAYQANEIDFDRFYTGMDSNVAAEHVHELLEGSYESREDHDREDETSIIRNIVSASSPKKLNVIVVVMESLSARYMGAFGNADELTPNLDILVKNSIFFDHVYATGTRTVRGLEAILLSIPPTPGQSILRRPAGAGIFNLGQVFMEHGYRANFIYGGQAIFDNMKFFFEGNGFSIFDQKTFSDEEVEFSNAWGVSDGDIFRKVANISDEQFKNNSPFFHVVLTTSNHRPYTFPEGKVRRKSGSGRLAAVQYADYAVGEFINSARTKPWFENTVFVFIADHNAAVSGGTRILPEDYLIPLIIFAPGIVTPRLVKKFGSQIDLAPTLLGLLNFSYQSRFFGVDLLSEDPNRAFLSTYQKIAYLTPDALTVLSPVKQIQSISWSPTQNDDPIPIKMEQVSSKAPESIKTTVAYYKVASDWFRGNLLKGSLKFEKNINVRGSR